MTAEQNQTSCRSSRRLASKLRTSLPYARNRTEVCQLRGLPVKLNPDAPEPTFAPVGLASFPLKEKTVRAPTLRARRTPSASRINTTHPLPFSRNEARPAGRTKSMTAASRASRKRATALRLHYCSVTASSAFPKRNSIGLPSGCESAGIPMPPTAKIVCCHTSEAEDVFSWRLLALRFRFHL